MDNELFQCPLETPFEDPENRQTELIKEQANLRRKLTFIYTAAGAGKNFDLREAEDIISRLFDVQQQLFPDGPSEAELEKAAVYTDRFRIIKECRSEPKKCNVSSSPPARQQNSIQLAPRQVPEFSGKFNDWIRFKGIFNRLVNNNPSLEVEDKEGYLLLSCKDEALRLIEPFIGHPSAYTSMWSALTKHYESSLKVKDNILDEIRKLPFLRYDLDENVKVFMEKASIIVSHVKQYFGNEPEFQRRVCTEFFHRMHQDFLNRNMDTMASMNDIIKTLEGCHSRRDRYVNHGLSVPGPPDDKKTNTPPKGSQRKANNQQSKTDACCAFCNESHFTNLCNSTAQSPPERRKIAADLKLCFNCLRSDHSRVKDCQSKFSCKVCKKKHHTLLHDPNFASRNSPDQQQLSQAAQQPGQTAIKQLHIQAEEWPTAGILMFLDENPDSSDPIVMAVFNNRKVRVYLDSCGGRTMIKRSLINASMIRQSNFIEFRGQFGGRQISADVVLFKAMLKDDKLVEFTAYVSNDADNDADIILGNDQFFKVMKQSSLTEDGYCFFETEIPGREVVKYGGRKKGHQANMNRVQAIRLEPPDVPDFERIFDRSPNTSQVPSKGLVAIDKLSDFELTTREDGRFEVGLKMKKSAPIPANNFRQAFCRMLKTQARLRKAGIFDKYEEHLMDYVRNGHAVMIKSPHPGTDLASYLPHHEVIKPDRETTKLRIVFDGSAGPRSLNKSLIKGEIDLNLIERIFDFRMRQVAMIGDIEKAFLQIGIKSDDQDWLRYLWQKDGSLQLFRMKCVPFGITSAPAVLAAVLRAQLLKYRDIYPDSVNRLLQIFYMDDLVSSFDTIDEAAKLKKEAESILSGAGFNLRKWSTNEPALRSTFADQAKVPTKVLGLVWNQITDTLSLHVDLPVLSKFTKRTALKVANSIFDPIGLIEPVRLKLKLMIQKLWDNKTPWDTPLPFDVANDLKMFIQSAPLLSKVDIQRKYLSNPPAVIHVFSDACQSSYGMVVFITSKDGANAFVQGKSRVAPSRAKKKMEKGDHLVKPKRTIPDLELNALTEAVESIPFLTEQFGRLPVIVWSDSECTLKRLMKPSAKRGVYVENRVARVHIICRKFNISFRKIDTKSNPADDYSRPLTVTEFLDRRSFECDLDLVKLANDADAYEVPDLAVVATINAASPGSVSKSAEIKRNSAKDASPIELEGFEHCETWESLIKAVKDRLQSQSDEEVQSAEAHRFIHLALQKQCANELTELEAIKRPHFIDDKGILRMRTRLPSESGPIWVPSNSRIADFIVKDIHLKSLHKGKHFTKALCNESYFIRKLDSKVHRLISHCLECQQRRKELMRQPTGMLPEFRTKDYAPWECIGLDYFGPITLHQESNKKYYGFLMTCCVSRQVDIELVTDMSSESCLAALNMFFNRNGLPRILLSDNGTNFIRTEKVLHAMVDAARNVMKDSVWNFNWKFIPSHTPRWGGLYERMISSIKASLPNMKECRNGTELRYMLSEATSIINSRPLFETDDGIITPAHYTIGRNLRSLPSGYGAGTINTLKAYRRIKQARSRFLKLWRLHYLQALAAQGLDKSRKPKAIEIGNVVIVREPNVPRGEWNLARIRKVFPGPDGITRRVEVVYLHDEERAKRDKPPAEPKVFTRSTENLIRLELDDQAASPEYVVE